MAFVGASIFLDYTLNGFSSYTTTTVTLSSITVSTNIAMGHGGFLAGSETGYSTYTGTRKYLNMIISSTSSTYSNIATYKLSTTSYGEGGVFYVYSECT